MPQSHASSGSVREEERHSSLAIPRILEVAHRHVIYTLIVMKQLRFRTRLIVILSLFAIVPAALLTLLWSGTVSSALPLVSGRAAWESVAASGQRAIAAVRTSRLTAAQRALVDDHDATNLLSNGKVIRGGRAGDAGSAHHHVGGSSHDGWT